VAACVADVARGSSVLGVPPVEQAKYAGGTFLCKASGQALPLTAVNDDFCDCADGSDEPGTGACAGQDATLFYCSNEGSAPRLLYSSRVADGVCDCCDGSDEVFFTGKRACTNTCSEEGKRLDAERALRLERLRTGLQKKREAETQAAEENKVRSEEVSKLEAELPALEKALEEAKADAEREAARIEKATCDKVPEACRWRQTGGCEPSGAREPPKDKTCRESIASGNSGFCDCDGDGILGNGEPGFKCTDTIPGTCCEECSRLIKTGTLRGTAPSSDDASASSPQTESEGSDASSETPKPQVSEYAKWMDGAEAELAEKADEGKEDKKVSEYAKWMEKAEAEEEETEEAEDSPATDSSSATAAKQKQSALQEDVRKHKDKLADLKKKLQALSADRLGYATLDSRTISRRVGEFEYKLNFFKDAYQGHTSLGKWHGWTGPYSAAFKGGAKCWEGPNRELTVNFQCGGEEKLEDVAEPSKCIYEALVIHPGACEEADLQRLSGSNVEVAGPKEEL